MSGNVNRRMSRPVQNFYEVYLSQNRHQFLGSKISNASENGFSFFHAFEIEGTEGRLPEGGGKLAGMGSQDS